MQINYIIDFLAYIVILILSFMYHILLYIGFIVMFGALFLALKSLKHKHRIRLTSNFDYPFVTIVVPSYNESTTIIRAIKGIKNLNYPKDKIEVFFIDDSTDDTFEIIKQETKDMNNAILIKNEKRLGKAHALNFAYKNGHGDYIVVFDADNKAHPDCLLHLLTSFDSSDIWATQGRYDVENMSLLTKLIDIEYAVWQTLEEPIYTFLHGYNYCIRRDVLDKIGSWREDILSEDTELTIRIYKNGGRVRYVPEARVELLEPTTLSGITKQRMRWLYGGYLSYKDNNEDDEHAVLKILAPPETYFPRDGRIMAFLSYLTKSTVIPGLGVALLFTLIAYFSEMLWQLPLLLLIVGYIDVILCLKRFDKFHLLPVLLLLPFYGLYEIVLVGIVKYKKRIKWEKVEKT
ncbi:MAG: glycosyltransferase [Candidatus Asgardarchaeia archaeon]